MRLIADVGKKWQILHNSTGPVTRTAGILT